MPQRRYTLSAEEVKFILRGIREIMHTDRMDCDEEQLKKKEAFYTHLVRKLEGQGSGGGLPQDVIDRIQEMRSRNVSYATIGRVLRIDPATAKKYRSPEAIAARQATSRRGNDRARERRNEGRN